MNSDIICCIQYYLSNQDFVRWSCACHTLHNIMKHMLIYHVHRMKTIMHSNVLSRLRFVSTNYISRYLIKHLSQCQRLHFGYNFGIDKNYIKPFQLSDTVRKLGISACNPLTFDFILQGYRNLEFLNIGYPRSHVTYEISSTSNYEIRYANSHFHLILPCQLNALMIGSKIIFDKYIPGLKNLYLTNVDNMNLSKLDQVKRCFVVVTRTGFHNTIWPATLQHLQINQSFCDQYDFPFTLRKLVMRAVYEFNSLIQNIFENTKYLTTLHLTGHYWINIEYLPVNLEHLKIEKFNQNLCALPSSLKTIRILQAKDRNFYTHTWPETLTYVFMHNFHSINYNLPSSLTYLNMDHYHGRLPHALRMMHVNTLSFEGSWPSSLKTFEIKHNCVCRA